MNHSFRKYFAAALLLALPLAFASCEGALDDIFGEWDKPSANTNTDPNTESVHSKQYLVYSYSTALDSAWTDIPANATVWTSDITESDLAAGTYVVAGADLKCAVQLVLKGEVNIILKDNCKLTVEKGIVYDVTNNVGSLNIYAQGISSKMGQLVVNNDTPDANDEATAVFAKSLEIHGGLVNATGDTGATPATNHGKALEGGTSFKVFNGKIVALGTGHGIATAAGDMFIYGGDIDAKSSSTTGAQAIYCYGDLAIAGGIVNAAPASAAATTRVSGITLPLTKTLTISGGTVTAKGSINNIGISADIINITGGTTKAYSGAGGRAAIKAVTSMKIEGSETQVTAIGANDDGINRSSLGIDSPLSITINGGTVNVTGGNGGAAQHNGAPAVFCTDGSNPGVLKVTGGTLIATGGNGSGGDDTYYIGGFGGIGICAAPIDFSGGTVIATGGNGGNGNTTVGSLGAGGDGGYGIECNGNMSVNASASVTATGGNGGNVKSGFSFVGQAGTGLRITGTLTGTITEINGTNGTSSL